MSSILDALERAEQERNQLDKKIFRDPGRVGAGLLQRRSLWVFVGLLLLINLVIWFWVVKGPQQSSVQPASSKAQSVPAGDPLATADTVVSILEQPQAGKSRRSDPPLMQEARVAKKEKVDLARSAEPLTSTTKPDAGHSSRTSVTAPPVSVSKQETVEPATAADAVAADMTEAEQTKVTEENRLAKVTEAEASSERPDEAIQPQTEQEETEQYPMLWELPVNVQEKLSDLKINILVYDEDPARRFVIINMHKYREGERLVPSGMLLERITRKGVVIDYGDGLVRL